MKWEVHISSYNLEPSVLRGVRYRSSQGGHTTRLRPRSCCIHQYYAAFKLCTTDMLKEGMLPGLLRLVAKDRQLLFAAFLSLIWILLQRKRKIAGLNSPWHHPIAASR